MIALEDDTKVDAGKDSIIEIDFEPPKYDPNVNYYGLAWATYMKNKDYLECIE